MTQGKGSKQRPRFIPLDQFAKQWERTFPRDESENVQKPEGEELDVAKTR